MRTIRGRVLIVSTAWWPAPARLAIALAREGFHVAAICPREHPLLHVGSVQEHYRYTAYRSPDALSSAIRGCDPDLLVPTDDRAAADLCALHGAGDSRIAGLIRRSLGDLDGFRAFGLRHATLNLADRLGIRVAPSRLLQCESDLDAWREPFPWVLKSSEGRASAGLCVVQDRDVARATLRSLLRRPRGRAALRHWMPHRDGLRVAPSPPRRMSEVIVQRYVAGTAASVAVACWNGALVGALGVQALRTQGPTGAPAVVRVVEAPEMVQAARRLTVALGLSGLHSLDFILDTAGRPWLIAANPCAIQLCHIARGGGPSLAAQLAAQLGGGTADGRSPAPADSLIALFPEAWNGAPNDPLLATAAHDVPWEEPALMRALMAPRSDGSLLARASRRAARRDPATLWEGTATPVFATPVRARLWAKV